jgi:hypothetical protein
VNNHVAYRGRPEIHATKIDTAYSTNIGKANRSMLGMSLVGDRTAAAIRITITAGRQTRNIQPAVTTPMRASTLVIAGICDTNPIPSMSRMMKSK